MVFSSIPVYVDPPNWQQQPNHHHQANGTDGAHQLLPPLPPQAPPVPSQVGSIRPGSMADRARLAKIPPPEVALKCPRCDSTNTKFCYFNNYSLSQPRHFARHAGVTGQEGELRNVPVGGGCRRNKKNKRSRSKSPATSEKQALSSPSSAIPSTHELLGQLPQPPNLPFMASLQNLSRYGVGNMGLGLREIQGQPDIGYPSSVGAMDQWRLQQVPFLNGFESSSGGSSYPFQSHENMEAPSNSGLVGVGDMATNSRVNQIPPIKMEDNNNHNNNNGALNLSRSSLNVAENNQYFSWTDMSGLASSSTSHLL